MNTQLGKVIAATTMLLAILLASTYAQASEYYKWTDDEGVVHFSEIPPTKYKAEKLKAQIRPPIVENVPDKDESEEETDAQEAKNETAPTSGISYKDEARCKVERERLAVLQSNKRIKLKQADGTSNYLDKAGLQREVSKTKEIIAKVCE